MAPGPAALRSRRPHRVAVVGPRSRACSTGARRRRRARGRRAWPGAEAGRPAMKGLVFERNLARFAASRVASALGGSGRGAAIGPLHLTDVEPPELPGRGVAPCPPRPGRDLRVGPVHGRRAQLAVLRRRRELPLRARPRGGRDARRHRRPGRDRARARLRGPRHHPALSRRAPRAARADASASPSAISPRGCRSGSAPTPAEAGRRGASSRTRPSSMPCPTTLTMTTP